MVILYDRFNFSEDIYEIIFATKQQEIVAKALIDAKRRADGPMTITPALKPSVVILGLGPGAQRSGLTLLHVSGANVSAGKDPISSMLCSSTTSTSSSTILDQRV